VCIKGAGKDEEDRLKRIKDRLIQVERDHDAAKLALTNGYAGADRWFEYNQKTVVRLRQLVEILESSQIEEGAQIKLRDGKDFSHLRRVIRVKAVEALEWGKPEAQFLSEMAGELGSSLG
jgi:hypothetical protein